MWVIFVMGNLAPSTFAVPPPDLPAAPAAATPLAGLLLCETRGTNAKLLMHKVSKKEARTPQNVFEITGKGKKRARWAALALVLFHFGTWRPI